MARTQFRNTQISDNSLTGADFVDPITFYNETVSYTIGTRVGWRLSEYQCIQNVTGTTAGNLANAPHLATAYWVVSSNNSWKYVVLDTDIVVQTTTNTVVTGLNFTPAANTRYTIECRLLVQTNTDITVGPRPGIQWPTAGVTNSAAIVQVPSSNILTTYRTFGTTTTANAASTGLESLNTSYLSKISATLSTSGSPAGTFQITLASELSAYMVTMRAGSFIRYRTF